ncbi:hypothetical protein Tco_0869753 [Tanacetum coccineum]
MATSLSLKDIEDEDVKIEVDDDVELIFPYEVEGDQTPPPRDESSDSEHKMRVTDSKSDDDEFVVAPWLSWWTAPWALRRDLEATRTRARLIEAELYNLTETVPFGLEGNKIVGVARMERDMAERSLHESRVWNKRFYLDMVRIGAVPKPPSDEEDTERPRKKSKKSSSDGTEGPSEPRGPPSDS